MLIGISGLASSGKDTTADHLVDQHGFQKLSFAGPIKDGIKAIFGLDSRHTDGDLKETVIEEYGVSCRHMMQTLGTEWGRALIRNDVWMIRMQSRLDEIYYLNPLARVAISDVRFENEAGLIRMLGGNVLHLQRDERPGVEHHISEAGVVCLDRDLSLSNNGTKEELHSKISLIVPTMNRGHVMNTP